MSLFFIRRAFFFVGLFLVAYCFLLVVIGRNMNLSFGSQFYYPEGGAGHSQLRFQEAALQRKIDLLFIGSSHAYRNYDPRIFKQAKLKAFNLGSTAQTPVQTLQILEELGENLSPKYLIIDFFLPLFYNEGIESSIDLLANTNFYPVFLNEHEDMKWYNALLYRTMSKNILHLKSKTCSETIGTDQYIRGGYVESHQPFNSKHETPKPSGHLNTKQIQAFAKVIQWANDRSIKWMVVQSPMMNVQAAVSYQSLPKEIQTLIPENQFINGQPSVSVIPEFFIDKDHLNAKGVKAFDLWLLDTLSKNTFFD
jgi:hypothetical protein